MVRMVILAASLTLAAGGAMAQQTCVTRPDGSFNCTTTASASTTAVSNANAARRAFQPDETGLLRIPTSEGEMLFHCDNAGPCRQIGLNPLPINR